MAGDAPQVRVLASIIGLRNPDDDADIPRSIEARVQVINDGDTPVRLAPDTLELVDGSLNTFADPRATPMDVLTVEPGTRGELTALFPFPPDQRPSRFDLTGLNLRWTLQVADRPVQQSVSFVRQRPQHDNQPRFGVGVGIGL
jgi:hypothetical protein